MYQVELVWNREFNFVPYGQPKDNLDDAIKYARAMENLGDGESVKSTRIVNREGEIVYANGRRTKNGSE